MPVFELTAPEALAATDAGSVERRIATSSHLEGAGAASLGATP